MSVELVLVVMTVYIGALVGWKWYRRVQYRRWLRDDYERRRTYRRHHDHRPLN